MSGQTTRESLPVTAVPVVAPVEVVPPLMTSSYVQLTTLARQFRSSTGRMCDELERLGVPAAVVAEAREKWAWTQVAQELFNALASAGCSVPVGDDGQLGLPF